MDENLQSTKFLLKDFISLTRWCNLSGVDIWEYLLNFA